MSTKKIEKRKKISTPAPANFFDRGVRRFPYFHSCAGGEAMMSRGGAALFNLSFAYD